MPSSDQAARRPSRPSWRRRLKSYAKHHTMDDLLMWAIAVSVAAVAIYYFFW